MKIMKTKVLKNHSNKNSKKVKNLLRWLQKEENIKYIIALLLPMLLTIILFLL